MAYTHATVLLVLLSSALSTPPARSSHFGIREICSPVLLISTPAIALANAAELQAMVAHEIGHEYVWIEWNRARQREDRERLKELELVCDVIAAVTLRQLGMDPSKVIDGVEKVTRFNRERLGLATNEKSYPTLAERRAFAREMDRWLRDSSWRSRSGLGRN